jgi:hypothetical protein
MALWMAARGCASGGMGLRSNHNLATVALAMVIVAAGVVKSSAVAQSNEPVVVLDSWWSVDYAKNMCSRTNACSVDPAAEAMNFEDRLATQLAANRQCSGVFVAKYRGRNFDHDKTTMDALQKRPHWTLIIDYIPGQETQSWWLRLEGGPHTQGEGDPKEIAGNVCSILTERGAKILK